MTQRLEEKPAGDSFTSRTGPLWRPSSDGACDDVCMVCGRTTILPGGLAIPRVLLCDGCEGKVHLACTNMDTVPAEEFFCCGCETRDICAACGETTMNDNGDQPLPDVLVCHFCACEIHLRCSGLGRMPTTRTPFYCRPCGGADVCAVCGAPTAAGGKPMDAVLTCSSCCVEVHLECSEFDHMPAEAFYCRRCSSRFPRR